MRNGPATAGRVPSIAAPAGRRGVSGQLLGARGDGDGRGGARGAGAAPDARRGTGARAAAGAGAGGARRAAGAAAAAAHGARLDRLRVRARRDCDVVAVRRHVPDVDAGQLLAGGGGRGGGRTADHRRGPARLPALPLLAAAEGAGGSPPTSARRWRWCTRSRRAWPAVLAAGGCGSARPATRTSASCGWARAHSGWPPG